VVKITKNEHKVEEPVQDNQSLDTNNIDVCKAHDEKINELTNDLKRLQAEFENYKKRSDKEYSTNIKNANARLISSMLPVLDSFELALRDHHEDKPELAKYRKGLELIYSQLYSILEHQGLRIITTKDQKFDPFKHEVLMVKESDKEDDIILQELQKGYMLNDMILRHSKVMISKFVGGN